MGIEPFGRLGERAAKSRSSPSDRTITYGLDIDV